MKIFYKSVRIGKNGKEFHLWKFRTLKEGTDKKQSFASHDSYTFLGKFLRKTKLDEFPQLWNLLNGTMNLVGPRPEEKKTIDIIPRDLRNIVLSVKPGLTSLSSLHFFDEEAILRESTDPHKTYWMQIKPTKIALDVFYVQNKNFMLDIAIIWTTAFKIVKSFF